MQKIDLIPEAENENENETAFCPEKMKAAEVDAAALSWAVRDRLGPLASLLADGRGIGLMVRGEDASVIGIADTNYLEELTPSYDTKAVQDMLDAVDADMSGKKLTEDQRELQKAATAAGAYAAAAYEAHVPKGGGECHALTRSFLLALIDPTHADLDYLRADPASGAAVRKSAQTYTSPGETHDQ
ncbi:hypothetical protein [Pseudophaeobacter flagellatus]|uniref:hypothetical protein n=1 Tax=Pseudophaeobacter flagellatus TaxID=2899119 RepID=UPI001E61A45E|nr:hypothetical protein [Pseudophaeobacter flagellatus]MCD9147783.1 hypothetical protein [Pseudophaeobacter flagellatus]